MDNEFRMHRIYTRNDLWNYGFEDFANKEGWIQAILMLKVFNRLIESLQKSLKKLNNKPALAKLAIGITPIVDYNYTVPKRLMDGKDSYKAGFSTIPFYFSL